MEFLAEYGMFLLKAATIVICIIIIIGAMMPRGRSVEGDQKGALKVNNVGERIADNCKCLSAELLHGKDKKEFQKEVKKQQKEVIQSDTGRLFVVNFKGDMQAKAASNLREEVSSIIRLANSNDEVLVNVESGGGVVHGYGFAASQLDRIRSKGCLLYTSPSPRDRG